jgi:hypothetical protein
MLTIDLEGARVLLDLLQSIQQGHLASEAELERALDANAFFVKFYSQWEGSSRETIAQAIRHFCQPERVPSGMLPTRLAEGFRRAMGEIDLARGRMAWLAEVDASEIAARVLAFLPPGTPLDSTVHITVDLFNNGFAHQGEIGVSLVHGVTDRKTFEDVVTHELHHVGFRFWSEQDAVRQALLQEPTGRAVAVMHVQNLLSEGMANYYCSPGYVFRASPQEPPSGPYQARLEAILALALEPGAAYDPCWEAFKAVAFDMEDAMLPAGHYLGARMVQTMEQVHPRSAIVGCAQRLWEFLPLYNEAASRAGRFIFFGDRLAERFAQLWAEKG